MNNAQHSNIRIEYPPITGIRHRWTLGVKCWMCFVKIFPQNTNQVGRAVPCAPQNSLKPSFLPTTAKGLAALPATVLTRSPQIQHDFYKARWILNIPVSVLIFPIRIYRWTISPALSFLFGPHGGCRFTPTCSQFAMDAIREHGAPAGLALSARRICRCHPWGGCGHDPVPGKTEGAKRGIEDGIVLKNAG
jgi:uncharacterized protein